MGKRRGRQVEERGRQQGAAQREPASHAQGAHTPAAPELNLGAAPSPAAHAVQLSRLGPAGGRQAAAQLQRAYGNRYVGRVAGQAAPLVVQPKLTVTPPGDQYEEEADRVAGQVMRQLQGGAVQRAPADEETQAPVMRKDVGATGGMAVSPGAESAIQGARGGGQPLPAATRAAMEGAIGADFSGVRVHTDGQAHTLNEALSARAFTTGQDIFFRQGEYAPGSAEGQQLLAHELAHVVQHSTSENTSTADIGTTLISCMTDDTAAKLNQKNYNEPEFDYLTRTKDGNLLWVFIVRHIDTSLNGLLDLEIHVHGESTKWNDVTKTNIRYRNEPTKLDDPAVHGAKIPDDWKSDKLLGLALLLRTKLIEFKGTMVEGRVV